MLILIFRRQLWKKFGLHFLMGGESLMWQQYGVISLLYLKHKFQIHIHKLWQKEQIFTESKEHY
ncbi:MAG: hypothetical protein BWK73_51995 [Thiothrix lacustris]|uniref:Uncharacterized protein n=1 Tax=Thiothrix lacustris TaxID=525917 RepID=A0A1Y1Q7X9_9GAMM|nr:MAG: hypothetical protein BWK73_51995 [Thiothrix lacustris]